MCGAESVIRIAKNYSPVLGVILGISLSLFFTIISFVYLRDFIEFMGIQYPKTPPLIISLMLIAICSYSAKSGIEVTGRLSLILILPVIMFIFIGIITSFAFISSTLVYKPIENWNSVIKGMLVHFSKTLELLVLVTLVPFLGTNSKYNISVIAPIALNSIIIVLLTLALYGNFDVFTKKLIYKLFELYREVIRADSLFIFVWVSTFYIKISLFLYASSISLCEAIDLKQLDAVIFPTGLFVAFLSLFSFSSYIDYNYFFLTSFSMFELFFAISFPIVILLILHKRINSNKT